MLSDSYDIFVTECINGPRNKDVASTTAVRQQSPTRRVCLPPGVMDRR